MTGQRLTAEQRRALAMLAALGHSGAMRSLLIANGFGVPMINAPVSHGFASLTYEKLLAGGKFIDIAEVRITEAGREAIEE